MKVNLKYINICERERKEREREIERKKERERKRVRERKKERESENVRVRVSFQVYNVKVYLSEICFNHSCICSRLFTIQCQENCRTQMFCRSY